MRDSICLAIAKGDHRHLRRERDLDRRRIQRASWQHIHQSWRQGGIFQTQIFLADLHATLHGGHHAIFLRKACVIQRQLHAFLSRNGHLQLGLVIFLIIAQRKWRVLAICLHM